MHRLIHLTAALTLGASFVANANPAHDQLVKLNEAKRNSMLASVISASGDKCTSIIRSFYQGSDKSGSAFWNATCRDGKSFVIMINDDSSGSTQVMSCALLKAMNAGECFKKFH